MKEESKKKKKENLEGKESYKAKQRIDKSVVAGMHR